MIKGTKPDVCSDLSIGVFISGIIGNFVVLKVLVTEKTVVTETFYSLMFSFLWTIKMLYADPYLYAHAPTYLPGMSDRQKGQRGSLGIVSQCMMAGSVLHQPR